MRPPLTAVLLALLVAPGRLLAQAPPPPAAASTPNLTVYRIGYQDELRITVFGEEDLSQLYRVSGDGFITMPLIGRISAAGTTPVELQDRIRQALAAGFINNPQVRVEVNQYKSQAVFVIGEVRQPGKIQMTGTRMTLLEALALAGSPTSNASNEVIVVHPNRPNPTGTPTPDAEGQRVSVNRKDLELGKAGQDVVLQDGDIINVPVAQRFYIQGMVRNPGYYVLDPGMTVQQAIALAGGLTDRGSDGRITASRTINGKSDNVRIELKDTVQAHDVINVPSRFF
jgi:polysaccharide export outer membrane protein